jgi:hypothetical protein
MKRRMMMMMMMMRLLMRSFCSECCLGLGEREGLRNVAGCDDGSGEG